MYRNGLLGLVGVALLLGGAAHGQLIPRAQVIRAADVLAGSVELLDEALHDYKAPSSVLQKVHHAEETVIEFRDLLTEPVKAVVLYPEFEHVREDVSEVWQLFRHGYTPQIRTLAWNTWKHFRFLARDFRGMDPSDIPKPNPNPNPNPAPALGGFDYEVVDGILNQVKGGEVSGKGTLLFKNPLPQDDNKFSFQFSLTGADSYLTLIANADSELENGVELSLYRNEDDSFGVELKVGAEVHDLSGDFEEVDATTALNVEVEVHEHGHVTVKFVGEEEQEFAFTTKVTGRQFGFSLDGATVSSFKLSKGGHDH